LQLAQYLESLRLECQLAILDQLEDGSGRDEAGYLACPEKSVGLHRYLVGDIRVAVSSRQDEAPIAHDGKCGAWQLVLRHEALRSPIKCC
jgi:hypothetical protein